MERHITAPLVRTSLLCGEAEGLLKATLDENSKIDAIRVCGYASRSDLHLAGVEAIANDLSLLRSVRRIAQLSPSGAALKEFALCVMDGPDLAESIEEMDDIGAFQSFDGYFSILFFKECAILSASDDATWSADQLMKAYEGDAIARARACTLVLPAPANYHHQAAQPGYLSNAFSDWRSMTLASRLGKLRELRFDIQMPGQISIMRAASSHLSEAQPPVPVW